MNAALIAIPVALVILALALAIRIVKQYERGVLFRLGRLQGTRQPGLRLIIPVVDVLHRAGRAGTAPQLVVVRNGHLVLTDSAERFSSAVEYDDDVVRRLKPDARTPDVVMDPRRSFGQPAAQRAHRRPGRGFPCRDQPRRARRPLRPHRHLGGRGVALRADRRKRARRLMVRGGDLVYFTDENTLGLGKLLRRSGRADVVYPGHQDLPEVPLGTLDPDWMPIIAAGGLVVLTRDKHIRTRPAEPRIHLEHGIRSMWIGAKQDLGPRDQLDLFLKHEHRLGREIIKRGPGPWALAMSATGIRPLHLRTRA